MAVVTKYEDLLTDGKTISALKKRLPKSSKIAIKMVSNSRRISKVIDIHATLIYNLHINYNAYIRNWSPKSFSQDC